MHKTLTISHLCFSKLQSLPIKQYAAGGHSATTLRRIWCFVMCFEILIFVLSLTLTLAGQTCGQTFLFLSTFRGLGWKKARHFRCRALYNFCENFTWKYHEPNKHFYPETDNFLCFVAIYVLLLLAWFFACFCDAKVGLFFS